MNDVGRNAFRMLNEELCPVIYASRRSVYRKTKKALKKAGVTATDYICKKV